MRDILFQYQLSPATWAYLSALMSIGIFFKFQRLWSIRNLDLLGLITFSPGLLLVFHGLLEREDAVIVGYSWLLLVGALFVVRLLFDPIMVRRPLLEPNLNGSGLTFSCIALMAFMAASVFAANPPERLEHVLAKAKQETKQDTSPLHSPGSPAFYYLSGFANSPIASEPNDRSNWKYPTKNVQIWVSRTIVFVAQLALIFGMVVLGYRHFDNVQTGVAAASLYLLLPYTSQMVGRIDHVVPAALLVWAVAAYRRPVVAGLLLGLVASLIFYPLFLLPLWCSFYWRRGLARFVGGFAFSLLVLALVTILLTPSGQSVASQLRPMFGWTVLSREGTVGFWEAYDPTYRIPVLAVFAVLSVSLGLWPAQKNLGALLSCTAAVMLASQFPHAHQGGLYMAWYLPLLVLTVFRPNLEDRIASSAVIEGRTTWVARSFSRLWDRAAGAARGAGSQDR